MEENIGKKHFHEAIAFGGIVKSLMEEPYVDDDILFSDWCLEHPYIDENEDPVGDALNLF